MRGHLLRLPLGPWPCNQSMPRNMSRRARRCWLMARSPQSAPWPALDFGAVLKHLMRHIIQRVGAGLWCLYEGVSDSLSQNAPVLAGSRSWSTNSPQLPAGVIHALISAPVTSERCQADWQVGITGRSAARHGRTFEVLNWHSIRLQTWTRHAQSPFVE